MKLLIEHANITVKSISEAKGFLSAAFPDFYERGGGTLGTNPPGKWCHFGNEETYIALQENGRPSGRSDITYTHDGINHLGFVIDDMETLITRMAAAGYQPSDASALDTHPHRKRAYFFDNNGFEWEFVEYLSEDTTKKNQYV